MKKLVNHYQYKTFYDEVINEEGKTEYLSHNSFLYACHPSRRYVTKMVPGSLPEYYCDMFRAGTTNDVISTKDIVDVYYTWVPENHFMKDSVLRISYRGKLEPYYETYEIGGKKVRSFFTSYTNEDNMIFGNNIFKFLAYIHKYSKCDLSKVREKFIEQCKWLEKNEHVYAPDLDNFKDYGEWFDNKIKIENYDNQRNHN